MKNRRIERRRLSLPLWMWLLHVRRGWWRKLIFLIHLSYVLLGTSWYVNAAKKLNSAVFKLITSRWMLKIFLHSVRPSILYFYRGWNRSSVLFLLMNIHCVDLSYPYGNVGHWNPRSGVQKRNGEGAAILRFFAIHWWSFELSIGLMELLSFWEGSCWVGGVPTAQLWLRYFWHFPKEDGTTYS